MDEVEDCYCTPELMDAFLEDFPFTDQDTSYSSQYISSFQDADTKKQYSEIKDDKLKKDLGRNNMEFKCNIQRICQNSQSMQPFLSAKVEKDILGDHQLSFKYTNSFTEEASIFQYNDTVNAITSNRGMAIVANDIPNKKVLPVPLYAENKNSYFITLANEAVVDKSNTEVSEFHHKINKHMVKEMKKPLHSERISNEKSGEKRHQISIFLQNKCNHTKKLNIKRKIWLKPCYMNNMPYHPYGNFVNTDSLLSLITMRMPSNTAVLMKSYNDSTSVSVSGTVKVTADKTFLYLHGHMTVTGCNQNMKYENTLQDINLTKFQLTDANFLKTETEIKIGDSDYQKYIICNTKNNLLNSKIKTQQKRVKCMKCNLQEGSNEYEATEEDTPETVLCLNHHITTNTNPRNANQEDLDERLKELTLSHITTISPKYYTNMQNFLVMILKTFKNKFQRSNIIFFDWIHVINATPCSINITNSSLPRNNENIKVTNLCNSNFNKIFTYVQKMESHPECNQPQHQLCIGSSSYHPISFHGDTHDNTCKIFPVQQISCDPNNIKLDIVDDNDLMDLVDKEVDLSLKQYENRSLELPQKKSQKDVECQTDLTLNSNKLYKYQLSDSSDTFNVSDPNELPAFCHKRNSVEIFVDDAVPTKRRCSTNVCEYQEVDTLKWKIERYLSDNVFSAGETNQIVPSSSADEGKYEFNSTELYSETQVLKDNMKVSAYHVSGTNPVKLTNKNSSSYESLSSINYRRPLRLGLSKRANPKRLHDHML